MTPTKEQQAQEYAEKKLRTTCPNMTLSRLDKAVDLFDTYDIQQAYADGYTAGEQSMWRSVEDELPEDREHIIICYQSYHEGRWLTLYITDRYEKESGFNGGWIKPEHVIAWMPIPELPNTNTEKR